MITLGCHTGGPERPAIRSLIGTAIQTVARTCGDGVLESGKPAVNIIFYVSGSLSQFYDKPGIEAGRFSKKHNYMIVAVPVPKDQVESQGSVAYVVDALREGIKIAADVFSKKGREPFDLHGATNVVDQVEVEMLRRHPSGHGDELPPIAWTPV